MGPSTSSMVRHWGHPPVLWAVDCRRGCGPPQPVTSRSLESSPAAWFVLRSRHLPVVPVVSSSQPPPSSAPVFKPGRMVGRLNRWMAPTHRSALVCRPNRVAAGKGGWPHFACPFVTCERWMAPFWMAARKDGWPLCVAPKRWMALFGGPFRWPPNCLGGLDPGFAPVWVSPISPQIPGTLCRRPHV